MAELQGTGRGPCRHHWVFMGVFYRHGKPASGFPRSRGVYELIYEDVFYCDRCLAKERRSPRVIGDTMRDPMPGTLPGFSES